MTWALVIQWAPLLAGLALLYAGAWARAPPVPAATAGERRKGVPMK